MEGIDEPRTCSAFGQSSKSPTAPSTSRTGQQSMKPWSFILPSTRDSFATKSFFLIVYIFHPSKFPFFGLPIINIILTCLKFKNIETHQSLRMLEGQFIQLGHSVFSMGNCRMRALIATTISTYVNFSLPIIYVLIYDIRAYFNKRTTNCHPDERLCSDPFPNVSHIVADPFSLDDVFRHRRRVRFGRLLVTRFKDPQLAFKISDCKGYGETM